MKQYFPFVILLISYLPSFSQEYIPIIEEGKHYLISSATSVGWTDGMLDYKMAGDTVIEGQTYKKVYRRELSTETWEQYYEYLPPYEIDKEILFAAMREDLIERKLYARFYDANYPSEYCENTPLGEEVLLFNFGQEVDEEVDFCPGFHPNNEGPLILDTIYVENIFGANRRVFGYAYHDASYEEGFLNYRYFEGFGTNFGPIYPYPIDILSDEGFHNVLNVCIGTDEECGLQNLVSNKNINKFDKEIKIFPSPSAGNLTIKISDAINEAGVFILTDISGKVIHTETLTAGSHNRFLDFPKGIYFANFAQNNTIVWRKKWVLF